MAAGISFSLQPYLAYFGTVSAKGRTTILVFHSVEEVFDRLLSAVDSCQSSLPSAYIHSY
jgi:hypothetical protein